jgi:hypothetical protein
LKYLSLSLASLVSLLVILQVGCATTSSYYDTSMEYGSDAVMMGDADEIDSSGLTLASPAPQAEHDIIPKQARVDVTQTRQMVYDGVIALLVDSISEKMDRTREIVEAADGYMQSIQNGVIVFKIPAAAFEDALRNIEALGEVSYKNIVGEDITDKMRDLGIRLKNAEQIRDRLAALLERAEKVEDALKIERELGRVTESIELLKGTLRVLENRIAFSTLTVKFNSPLPQQTVKQKIPFPWVLKLGGDMVAGGGPNFYYNRRSSRHLKFDLPVSFAKYEESRNLTRATSADGVLIKVERHANVDGGDLTFWKKYIRQALAARRAIRIPDERLLETRRGEDTVILLGRKDIGGEPYGYIIAIMQTDKYVLTYEAWGPAEVLKLCESTIEKSILTVRL